MSGGKRKTKAVPSAAKNIQDGAQQRPRRQFDPDRSPDNLVIRFNHVDVGSDWCLTNITRGDHAKLLDRLRSFEQMRADQVFAPGSEEGKTYDVDALPNKDAVRRLVDLGYEDQDTIARLRITGKRRLYGFLIGNQFYALWWDPEHLIWPSKK